MNHRACCSVTKLVMPEDRERKPEDFPSSFHFFPPPDGSHAGAAHREPIDKRALEKAQKRFERGIAPQTPQRPTVFPDENEPNKQRPTRNHTFPQSPSRRTPSQRKTPAANAVKKADDEGPEPSRTSLFSGEHKLDENPTHPTRVRTFPLATHNVVKAEKRVTHRPGYVATMGRFTFPEGEPLTAHGSLRVRPIKPEHCVWFPENAHSSRSP